jgi:hypothetical protein
MAANQLTPEEKLAKKREINRRWRANHLEQERAKSRARGTTEEAKQKKREYMQKWRDSNPEEARVYSRVNGARWRAAHPERVKEINRRANAKWRAAHLEEERARDRKRGPEEYRAHLEERQRRNNLYNHARWRGDGRMLLLVKTARLRAEKRGLEFDGLANIEMPRECCCCGKQFDMTAKDRRDSPSLDRWDPAKGYTCENVRVICFRCNVLKNDATADEIRKVLAYMERP